MNHLFFISEYLFSIIPIQHSVWLYVVRAVEDSNIQRGFKYEPERHHLATHLGSLADLARIAGGRTWSKYKRWAALIAPNWAEFRLVFTICLHIIRFCWTGVASWFTLRCNQQWITTFSKLGTTKYMIRWRHYEVIMTSYW